MAGLADVREGLMDRLATIAGLEVSDVWPDTVNPPCAVVLPGPDRVATPHTAFASRGSYYLQVIMLGPVGTLADGQRRLDDYLDMTGATSVLAAIEGDETLGGATEGLLCGEWQGYGTREANGVKYISATMPVECWVI